MRKFLAEIHMRLLYISRNNFAINCELQQFTGHGAHRPQSALDSPVYANEDHLWTLTDANASDTFTR